jgi:hypothetical protein
MSLALTAEMDAGIPQEKDEDSKDVKLRIMTDADDDDILRLEVLDKSGEEVLFSVVAGRDDLLEAVARLAGVSFGESVPRQEPT